MGSLTTFIYDFIERNVDDPNSNNWLPRSLNKYELIQEGPINIDLPETENMLSSQLLFYFKQIVEQSLASDKALQKEVHDKVDIKIDKDDSNLLFEITDLTMLGLENSKLMPLQSEVRDDEHGTFDLDVSLYGPEYDPEQYKDLINKFDITLKFRLVQKFCAYLRKTTTPADSVHVEKLFDHGWPRSTMELKGDLNITLTDTQNYPVKLETRIVYSIDSSGDDRKLCGDVTQVDISTDFVKNSFFGITGFQSEYPSYNQKLCDCVQTQFKNHFVIDSLLKNVIAMLNEEKLKSGLSEQLTEYTLQEFDNVLGPVEGVLPITKEQEKNAVDQYIFDRIRYSVCNKDSAYNINKVIKGCKDPLLDPWDLGSLDLGKIDQFKTFDIDNFSMSNIVMTGLSDMVVENDDIGFISAKDETEQDYVTLTAKLTMTIDGDVSFLIENESVAGRFKVTLDNNPFNIKCAISGNTVDDFTFLLVADEKTGIEFNQDQIHIALKIPGTLTGLIEKILNQVPVKKLLIKEINKNIDDNTGKISDIATERIKAIFNEANKK